MFNSGGFRLVVRRGPQPNQVYELNKDRITIGRDITNEITVNDPEVSRHHCRLTRGQGGFTMEDLGSTNGTFINGRRLTGAQPLNQGDLIGLGETVTLAYEASIGAAPAAVAPSPYGAAPDPGQYAGGTSPAPAAAAQPRQDYYEQQPPPAYYAAQQQPYYPGPTGTGANQAYYPQQPGARGSRGCGLMIGCGIFLVLLVVIIIVGIIVVDSPLDDIPLISNGAGAVPLPGSSVDNAEKFFNALGDCDAEEAIKYVCNDEEAATSALISSSAASCPTIEDIKCEQDGSDVTCSYSQVSNGSTDTIEATMNIRNGKICGTVTFLSDLGSDN